MEHRRRKSDKLIDEHDKAEQRILELIEDTDNSKDKGFLLILLKINSSLADNTRVVNDVASRLEEHVEYFQQYTDEEKRNRNQITGAKKVWGYVMPVLQSIIIALVAYYQSELVDIRNEVNHIHIEQTRIETTLNQLKGH